MAKDLARAERSRAIQKQRWANATPEERRAAVQPAIDAHKAKGIARRAQQIIDQLVEEAPPLSPAQRDQLAALLAPYADEPAGDRQASA
jgi:hypothetical protein